MLQAREAKSNTPLKTWQKPASFWLAQRFPSWAVTKASVSPEEPSATWLWGVPQVRCTGKWGPSLPAPCRNSSGWWEKVLVIELRFDRNKNIFVLKCTTFVFLLKCYEWFRSYIAFSSLGVIYKLNKMYFIRKHIRYKILLHKKLFDFAFKFLILFWCVYFNNFLMSVD